MDDQVRSPLPPSQSELNTDMPEGLDPVSPESGTGSPTGDTLTSNSVDKPSDLKEPSSNETREDDLEAEDRLLEDKDAADGGDASQDSVSNDLDANDNDTNTVQEDATEMDVDVPSTEFTEQNGSNKDGAEAGEIIEAPESSEAQSASEVPDESESFETSEPVESPEPPESLKTLEATEAMECSEAPESPRDDLEDVVTPSVPVDDIAIEDKPDQVDEEQKKPEEVQTEDAGPSSNRDNPNPGFEEVSTKEHEDNSNREQKLEEPDNRNRNENDSQQADDSMDVCTVNDEDPFAVSEAMDVDENKDDKTDGGDNVEPTEANARTRDQNEETTENTDETQEDEVTDLEEGKGADDEVCLLPDTEREISQADKDRAILTKESLSKEKQEAGFDALLGKEKTEPTSNNIDAQDASEKLNNISGTENCEENNVPDSPLAEKADEILHKDSEDKELENESAEIAEADLDTTETLSNNTIQEITEIEQSCLQCGETKPCKYTLLSEDDKKYICNPDCLKNFQAVHPDKYTITVKKVVVKEIVESEHTCTQCSETKLCKYETGRDEKRFICSEACLKAMQSEHAAKYVIKYKKVVVQEVLSTEQKCYKCGEVKPSIYQFQLKVEDLYVCDMTCLSALQDEFPDKYKLKIKKGFRVKEMPRLMNQVPKENNEPLKIAARSEEDAESARLDRERSFVRKCYNCMEPITGDEKNLSWETMDFCNEDCLGRFQNVAHANCSNCKNHVQPASLGKYCVRFGYDIRQFCCSGCLEEFKKGLKVCSYCQKDISGGYEGFLAPVGDKGQFKDFCTQACMEKYDQMSNNGGVSTVVCHCSVCNKEKPVRVEVLLDGHDHKLCSNPCFSAFKFVNKVFPDQCEMCKKYYERKSMEHFTIYQDSVARTFCTKSCMNVFILSNRKIVPCNWCKVKKYNFDMIRRELANGQIIMMCSLNCLTLYQVSVNAVSMRRIKCDHCKSLSQAQYHLTMSDATIRNFCTYGCVMSFQQQYAKSPITLAGEQQPPATPATPPVKVPVPTGVPKRTYHNTRTNKVTKPQINKTSYTTPIISNVQSLAPPAQPASGHHTRGSSKQQQQQQQQQQQKQQQQQQKQQQQIPVMMPPPPAPAPPPPPPKPIIKYQQHVVIQPAPPKPVSNMSTMCKPITHSKGVSCKPHQSSKECQTDSSLEKRYLIPIPIPIYVPMPLSMWSMPTPIPVPIPLPIPVPVFIPTTRNSAAGIMKEIKKIHEKMPTDPFEAELLMMAEMVAGDKKEKCESDSESEEEAPEDDGFSPEGMEASSSFGEDMLQMALKMATEYDEPAVDLESAMTASTITPSSHPPMVGAASGEEGVDDPNPMHHHHMMIMEQHRAAMRGGRKRPSRQAANRNSMGGTPNKRNRRVSNTVEMPMMQPPSQPEQTREPAEKPDANMCLKYTFGVNAWKQWVMTKNADLEKSSIRRKPFKSEILQLTADELNYSLCLFVKEVRKPNGSEYAPDTIYYLVLGIQQYLFENGRIDNIFTDAYYEKFTECLDEVAKKFSVLYNDSQYIVTRVEEEHLWESKQLGAHSPHVLLSTLMFFNTKHFNLVTVEEHMQLSFSHIMKHWKRNPNQPGAAKVPGSRNVLLRFYPPQAALEANSRKKKVYEQQENEENPLRCPVKLYEFYLSKCPESVKTRNDVFYLLPERSCVPDSPVWYSTMALGKEPLMKMLHRVKMVKEINIALLTS